jgi:hypothetical protein
MRWEFLITEGLMKRVKKSAGKMVSGLFIALSNTTCFVERIQAILNLFCCFGLLFFSHRNLFKRRFYTMWHVCRVYE